MSTRIAEQISEILGRDKLPQIRVALGESESGGETPTPIDWDAELKAAQTVEECRRVHRNTPDGNERQTRALEKAFWVAKSVADWKLVFSMTKPNSREGDICIQEIAELLFTKQAM